MQTLREVETFLATLPFRIGSYETRLEHVSSILARLGSPQNSVPSINIAGTSGKGSTAYYAAGMLREAGYTVGLMVSPHVSKVSERAQINGQPLSDAEFCQLISKFREVLNSLKETTTYIEFLTCFAFWVFARKSVDYMVIEVGLGGRLDPTNVLARPDTVRVITDIGYDHTEILGNTLKAIAAEKAGIIHTNNPVCMHPQDDEVMESVTAAVKAHNAELILVKESQPTSNEPHGYQFRNWTLAKQAVITRLKHDERPPLTETQLLSAAKTTLIPGRFEQLTNNEETIVLDAAHNPQKMAAFTETLRATYPTQHIVAVVALGKNKQISASETLHILTDAVNQLIFTEFIVDGDETHGSLEASSLAELVDTSASEVIPSPQQAITKARSLSREEKGITVVTGSFYLVGDMRNYLTSSFNSLQNPPKPRIV